MWMVVFFRLSKIQAIQYNEIHVYTLLAAGYSLTQRSCHLGIAVFRTVQSSCKTDYTNLINNQV